MTYQLANRYLHKAIFDTLGKDAALAPLFSITEGPRKNLPRLDFDFLQTRAEDAENLFRHVFQFSLWTDLHNLKQGDHLAQALHDCFHDRDINLQDMTLIFLRFESLIVRKDKQSRYNEHQIRFHALTQSAI